MGYIIGLTGLVFLFTFITRSYAAVDGLILIPDLVRQGQIWRLLTYIFIPPTSSFIFILFILYFYYFIGAGLENEWGSFKFNVYYLAGMAVTTVAAFITNNVATNTFINLSLFLAFAQIYPDYEILIFFILPVKMKYLAWLSWAFYGYSVLTADWPGKIFAIVSLLNFFLFFGKDFFSGVHRRGQRSNRRKKFFDEIASTPPIHTCAVCGRTDKSDPRMEFKYCKECGEDYVYCLHHIDDHPHKTPDPQTKH